MDLGYQGKLMRKTHEYIEEGNNEITIPSKIKITSGGI